jgi:hypothetical protein
MSSLDPIRFAESEEDRALREELRQLLGVPNSNFFEVEPTAEMISLADDLRREAERRRRTARHRPARMLLAAGLPLALVFAGVGAWGFQQKQRADALAAMVAQKEQQLQRAAAIQERQNNNLRMVLARLEKPTTKNGKPSGPQPAELVIQVDDQPLPSQSQTDQVKDHH